MFKKILIWLGVLIVLGLVVLWIVGGGIGRIIEGVKGARESSAVGFWNFGSFRLPWQPEGLLFDPIDFGGAEDGEKTLEQEFALLQSDYEALEEDMRAGREFGIPSPYRNMVYIDGSGGMFAADASAEYIRLGADRNNTSPVDITGWSLQSALTGVRAYIPRGAHEFRMGAVNEQKNIQLIAGDAAIILTGASPVGTSFRENMCTGYLNQLQSFSPQLTERCPSPRDAVPLTADTLNMYGDTCIDFARALPACRAPLSDFPPDTSASCRTFVANTLSYNGCVAAYRHRADFAENSWRIYLSSPRELWRNTHDVIRLLDAEGRTVDAITY